MPTSNVRKLKERLSKRKTRQPVWDEVPLSKIEHEILAITDWRPMHGDYRWRYLVNLAKEGDRVDDEIWESAYSEETQKWIDDTLDRLEQILPPKEPNEIAPARRAVSRGTQTKGKGLSYHIRDIICEDPNISFKGMLEKLEEIGFEADEKSVKTVFSYTRSAIRHAIDKGLIRKE